MAAVSTDGSQYVTVPAAVHQELERLRQQCRQLEAERDTLRAQLQRRSAPVFEVSPDVTLVSGRLPRVVPLFELLARARTAAVAEADTPTCGGAGDPPPWAALAQAVPASRTAPTATACPAAAPEAAAATSGAGANPSKQRRPAPLSTGVLREPTVDALVSGHTLRSFQLQWEAADEEQASGRSCAGGILNYLLGPGGFSQTGEGEFVHPPGHAESFGRKLIFLCEEVRRLLRTEPLHLSVVSPCFVFGDIHGNFTDASYFVEQMLPFRDIQMSASQFLFLGDYVDRGSNSVECIALLFALKVLAPSKVWLMRGNHEDRLINGNVKQYGQGSFRAQCGSLFGELLGDKVWDAANAAFQWLPLTANIDGVIFCTHGGIPRKNSRPGEPDRRMDVLCSTPDFPRFQTLFEWNPDEPPYVTFCRQVASDICWSDPSEQEAGLNDDGFGPNPRGEGIIEFGSRAVDDFLQQFGYQYIFRAHQEKADGIKVSKNRRVITIFSSSDYIGHANGAGAVYVVDGMIRMVIKEPGRDDLQLPLEPLSAEQQPHVPPPYDAH